MFIYHKYTVDCHTNDSFALSQSMARASERSSSHVRVRHALVDWLGAGRGPLLLALDHNLVVKVPATYAHAVIMVPSEHAGWRVSKSTTHVT